MTTETAALAALLLAGHALGDFVFQTTWMVERKSSARGLFAHVGVVALCHAALLLPLAGSRPWLAVPAIAAAHLAIDAGKAAAGRAAPRFAREWFLLDQAAHVAVVVAAWAWLAPEAAFRPGLPLGPNHFYGFGVLATLVAVNVNGVSAWVAMELERWKLLPEGEGVLPAGRVIGVLERLFIVVLVLMDQWGGLGLLLAAKSLARFRELDDQRRAEYYLVGTLMSFLAAVVTTLAARLLLL